MHIQFYSWSKLASVCLFLPYSLKQQYGYLKVSVIELENIPVSTEVVLAYKQSNKKCSA